MTGVTSGITVPALRVRNLTKTFGGRRSWFHKPEPLVQAVSGIDFDVNPGEILGVVGESGCGKSTTARLLMRLMRPDSGEIAIGGVPAGDDPISLRMLRRAMQMVFQDSYASLNPRLTAVDSIAFGPKVQGAGRGEARRAAEELLAQVGLDPTRFSGRYPHELSGGQRQRVNIARALAFRPRILILDEPVSALDKSVEAQVVNLLCDLHEALGLSFVFISHDLGVVRYLSDRVMVMYLGRVAEIGPVDRIYDSPRHPYTRALLAARLSLYPAERLTAPPLQGDPPNPINPPSGCRFRTRCSFAEEVCAARMPTLAAAGSDAHRVACHMAESGSGHSLAGSGT